MAVWKGSLKNINSQRGFCASFGLSLLLATRLNRPLLLCVSILLCLASCQRIYAFADTSSDVSSDQTVIVRLVDPDGKPVEGAHVGHYVAFGKRYEQPADESGWHYWPHTVSDSDGLARITGDREALNCLTARHVDRKLVAIQSVSPEQWKETVTVVMQPQCQVFGKLFSQELEACNQKLTWSMAYLYLDGNCLLGCSSKQASFHFYVPPGTYRLHAYGTETFGVDKTITVQPDQKELEVEPINMAPKRWVLLKGKPAPKLQEIVAWKNSKPLKLSELQGKVIILEFWGYWCGPCLQRMPALFTVYDKYHNRGLVVIGIHVDMGQEIDSIIKLDEKLTEVKKHFWKDRDIPFPVALVLENRVPFRPDVDKKAACLLTAEYGIDSIPTGILIDRQGRVVGSFTTGNNLDEAVLEKVLEEK